MAKHTHPITPAHPYRHTYSHTHTHTEELSKANIPTVRLRKEERGSISLVHAKLMEHLDFNLEKILSV
jgi:hypothetical protein